MDNNAIGKAIQQLKSGDMVYINDWRDCMVVVGADDAHVVMYDGDNRYTIIQRAPNDIPYNCIPLGAYVCGPDNWVFAPPISIDGVDVGCHRFSDPRWVEAYLQSLRRGETQISLRNRAQIYFVQVV